MRNFIILLFITALTLLAQADSIAMVADCYDKAFEYATRRGQDNEIYKQTETIEDYAVPLRPIEKKIRNLCIHDVWQVDWNCYAYKCAVENDLDTSALPLLIVYNFPLEQVCDFLTIEDCVNKDIPYLEEKIRKLGTPPSRRVLYDMDKLVLRLEYSSDGNGVVSTSPGVCYSADSKGDSIWHALVRRNAQDKVWDMFYWELFATTCLDQLKSDEKLMYELYQAVFLRKNDNNKTPIAEAVERGNLGRFSAFRDYFKQNNIDYKKLLRAAADEAGISYQKLSKAWEEGTELEVHKKINVDKSGLNIKTKYK